MPLELVSECEATLSNAGIVDVSGGARSVHAAWPPPALTLRREAVSRKAHVLLVDEARENHALLERIAGRLGASVQHARSASDGLRYAREFCYDALIIEAGGGHAPLPLLEQLSALQATAGVLLSGEGLHFPEGFSLSGNLLGSLGKPWNDEEIEAALGRALELSRARRQHRPLASAPSAIFERVLLIGSVGDLRRYGRMLRGWVPLGGLVHACSLQEGLTLIGQHTFDLALTDLWLPDACGLDAVVRIRQASSQTPVVVLTALEDSALEEQALHAGAQDVLVKTELSASALLRSMRRARQRQLAQAQLYHGSLHDELTSLAKRTLLQQRIANALARSRRLGNTFAVIYIDLDHFKSINDTHGHEVGDAVLVAVSSRLKAAVREYDTVARIGGDEFAILLDTLDDVAEAECVAQRVLSSLAPPMRVADHDVEVTASMGISVFPAGGSAADELLRSADRAMYRAKRAGRNTYSLSPPIESSRAPEPARSAELRRPSSF